MNLNNLNQHDKCLVLYAAVLSVCSRVVAYQQETISSFDAEYLHDLARVVIETFEENKHV